MFKYKGQCLCGSIKYGVDKIEPKMAHCHCKMCRKFHGTAFSTYGEALKENFHWLEGEELLKVYKASNGTKRKFCKHCGSSMTFSPAGDDGSVIEFSLGTLESPIEQRPDVHVYVSSKADWVEINDDLPQHQRGRDSTLVTNKSPKY